MREGFPARLQSIPSAGNSSDETQMEPETWGSHKAEPCSWKEKHTGDFLRAFVAEFCQQRGQKGSSKKGSVGPRTHPSHGGCFS